MLGQSFLINKFVSFVAAEVFDADDDTAQALGTLAGVVTAFALLDLSGGTWTVATLGSEAAVEQMRERSLDL